MKIITYALSVTLSLSPVLPLLAQEDPAAGAVPAVAEAAPAVLTAEIQIGTGIENHEPVGVSESFSKDTAQVVAWTRIKGAKEPTEVRHVWKLNGKEKDSVALNVQSSSFRTFSRKTINGQTGTWTLEVRDAEGRVIASKNFEVTAAPAQ